MPLIHSDRHRPEDIAAWEQQSRYDHALARGLGSKPGRAQSVIRHFAEAGSCYIGCSWGKDSMVVAHLAATSGVRLPLVWVRVEQWENPDCPAVRDAFLDKLGHLVDYEEITVPATAPRRWEQPGQGNARTSSGGFAQAAARHGGRHISGVRGAESSTRRMTMRRNGETSATTCRPIGNWSGEDVFAYLHAHDLPIHPAYAMNRAGALHRNHIRVGSLGGERGTGVGRDVWERAYYPDVVRA